MFNGKLACVVVSALGLFACGGGHATMRGSVVMRVNATDAHVCLGNDEVRIGDRVDLVHHVCEPLGGKAALASERCKPQLAGAGEVVEVLNTHYSVVRFPAGVTFSEGDTVEKHK